MLPTVVKTKCGHTTGKASLQQVSTVIREWSTLTLFLSLSLCFGLFIPCEILAVTYFPTPKFWSNRNAGHWPCSGTNLHVTFWSYSLLWSAHSRNHHNTFFHSGNIVALSCPWLMQKGIHVRSDLKVLLITLKTELACPLILVWSHYTLYSVTYSTLSEYRAMSPRRKKKSAGCRAFFLFS